jgi:hypothetical protein
VLERAGDDVQVAAVWRDQGRVVDPLVVPAVGRATGVVYGLNHGARRGVTAAEVTPLPMLVGVTW